MIVVGVILLLLGYLFGVGVLVTIGFVLLLVGVVLLLLDVLGRPVGGRRWY